MSTVNHNEKLAELLNDLIKINNDRIEGYRKAAKHADGNQDLEIMFYEKALQSEDFTNQLKFYVTSLGMETADNTTAAGKIFRTWMEFKSRFIRNDKTSILEDCEFGEEAAINAYEDALLIDIQMPPEIRHLLFMQLSEIKRSYEAIKTYKILFVS